MESTRPIRALTRGLDALTVLNARDGGTVSGIARPHIDALGRDIAWPLFLASDYGTSMLVRLATLNAMPCSIGSLA